MGVCQKQDYGSYIQWSLDIAKRQGTGKICSLQEGFVISRFFFTYFITTGVKKKKKSFVIPRTYVQS